MKFLLENKPGRGFTMIEILIVLGIISILAVAAIPVFDSFTIQSRIDDLKANILKAANSQEKYFTATGRYAPKSTMLDSYDYPDIDNPKMKLFTGVILREGIGMTYWVAGNFDVTPHTGNYNECWIYFGSLIGTGGADNFLRIYDEEKNITTDLSGCSACPTADEVCK